MNKNTVEQALAHIDIPKLVEKATELLEKGHTKAEVVTTIVAIVDSLIPWNILLPPPVGLLVEALDGPIANAVALCIVEMAAKPKRKKKA